jgi:hypothetical protein
MGFDDIIRLFLRAHCGGDIVSTLLGGQQGFVIGVHMPTSMRIQSMWEATKPLAPVNRTRGPCPFDMVVEKYSNRKCPMGMKWSALKTSLYLEDFSQ